MVINRFNVWSVARLYGAIAAGVGLFIGVLFALGALVGGLASVGAGNRSGAFGALFGVGAVVFLPIFYGVVGVISGAVTAFLYNLCAGMFGGVEFDVDKGGPAFDQQFFPKKADL